MADSALDKALEVLEALVALGPAAPLAAIAERSGVSKPSCHRILATFVQRGYAHSDGNGTYSAGTELLFQAGQILAKLDYGRHARPALIALQALIPETVHFAVLNGSDLVYAEKLEGRRAFRMASTIGQRLSLHCTAIGKVVLAYSSTDERRALLGDGELAGRTPNTLTDPTRLDRELETTRRRGYAIDDEENEAGIRCVAAAVFSNAGRVMGGVSVSSPAFQLSLEQAPVAARHVIAAAELISRALGAPSSRTLDTRAAAVQSPPGWEGAAAER